MGNESTVLLNYFAATMGVPHQADAVVIHHTSLLVITLQTCY